MANWMKTPGLMKSATKVSLSPMAFAKEHSGEPFKSHMPKGATQSPKGDIGKWKDEENRAAGGFTEGKRPTSSEMFKVRPFQKAGGDNS